MIVLADHIPMLLKNVCSFLHINHFYTFIKSYSNVFDEYLLLLPFLHFSLFFKLHFVSISTFTKSTKFTFFMIILADYIPMLLKNVCSYYTFTIFTLLSNFYLTIFPSYKFTKNTFFNIISRRLSL